MKEQKTKTQNNTELSKLNSLQQAADKMNMSVRTVQRLIKEKQLGYFRPSPGRVCVSDDQIQAYLNLVRVDF